MSKPVGYYTSYTPGDQSYLEQLQEVYGAKFEQMSNREKLYLISSIASALAEAEGGAIRLEIQEIARRIPVILQAHDHLGLIEALTAQVRWGENAEPIHHS